MPPVHGHTPGARPSSPDDAINDELADPWDRQGDDGPDGADREDRDRVAAVRLVHESQQGRDVLERFQPLPPAGRLAVPLRQEAPGPGQHPVGDKTRRRGHALNFLPGRLVNITA